MTTNPVRTAPLTHEPPFGLAVTRGYIEPAGWLLKLVLQPRTPAAQLDDLSGLGWPTWGHDVLLRDPRWVISIDGATRRLMQIVRLNDAQDAVQNHLFDLGAGIPLDDRLWSAVEGERPVILCGPFRGETTTEAMDAAKDAGTLRGIAARSLIR
ncbi:hypothetical protein ABT095_14915 [Kitasatospora sp. NPDC002227]|uniref:hypothetical protein n=1 Tax=Kitasatospora sp. NPDC002227 TaxID=3154773 RepID=UPI003316D2E8